MFGDELQKSPNAAYVPNMMAIAQRENLYAHCINNPLIYYDRSGNDAGTLAATGGGIMLTPIPGARIVGGLFLLAAGAVIIFSGSNSNSTPPPPPAPNAVDVAPVIGGFAIGAAAIAPGLPPINRELERIAGRYGRIGLCGAAARAMARTLRRMGRTPQYAEMLFTYGSNVFSHTGRFGGIPISTNGYHVGILADGRVHCNVHPRGLPTTQWFNDFWTPGQLLGNEQQLTNIGPVPKLGTISTFHPP